MDGDLFDVFNRISLEPSDYAESKFSYLNRTARYPMALVRRRLQDWFDDYPINARKEFLGRFRSKDDRHHLAAFFELYCHALLRSQEFDIQVHPDCCSTDNNRPDFLVYESGEPKFFFEAISASENSIEAGANARRAKLQDGINQISIPGYFLQISIESVGPSSHRIKPVHDFIITFADEVCRLPHRPSWRESREYFSEGWRIRFSLHALENADTKISRPIGMITDPAQCTDCDAAIVRALEKKKSKYGDLSLPFVIGVNCTDDFTDGEDIRDALFGKCVYLDQSGSNEREAKAVGWDGKGFWFGPRGSRNEQVIGVFVATQLVPWTIGSSSPVLWLNPFATVQFRSHIWKLPMQVQNSASGEIELIRNVEANQMLNTREISEAIRDEQLGIA